MRASLTFLLIAIIGVIADDFERLEITLLKRLLTDLVNNDDKRAVDYGVTVGPGSCSQNGNTYRPLLNVNCASFTQETANLPPKTLNCPSGLMFDIVTCVCNYPQVTKCGNRNPGPDSGNAMVYPPKPTSPYQGYCQQNGNTYRPLLNTNCASFTQETANLPPKTLYCPSGLKFDTNLCCCNYPSVTRCPASHANEGSGRPAQSGAGTAAEGSAVVYPTQTGSCSQNGNTYRPLLNRNCASFTQETANLPPTTLNCPSGLMFDIVTCVCNYPQVTKCGDRNPGTDSGNAVVFPPKPTNPYQGFCQQNGNTYKPLLKTNCDSYTQETAYLPPKTLNCPSGLKFDTTLCCCNYPSVTRCPGNQVNDDNSPLPESGDAKVTYVPQAGSCSQNGNTYRPLLNRNCASFTQETANLPPTTLNCPSGLMFDLITCVCNYPQVTKCGDRNPGTDSGNAVVYPPKPGTPYQGFCLQNGNTYRPLLNRTCASFTQETAYLPPKTLDCPRGLMFDTTLCVCNYPSVTQCPARLSVRGFDVLNDGLFSQPETRDAGGVREVELRSVYDTSLGSCQENGNTYRPLPNTECKRFSQETASLAPEVFDCPAGLLFDVSTCVCNWPSASRCGQQGSGGGATSDQAVVPPPKVYPGSCYQNGNTYTPVPYTHCTRFTQEPSSTVLTCPNGLKFDTYTCVCNWPFFTSCPY